MSRGRVRSGAHAVNLGKCTNAVLAGIQTTVFQTRKEC